MTELLALASRQWQSIVFFHVNRHVPAGWRIAWEKASAGISGITSGCRCWGGIPGSTRDSLAGWLGNLGIDNDPENGYQDNTTTPMTISDFSFGWPGGGEFLL